MNDVDRQLFLEGLQESRESFLSSLSGVSDAEAVWKPAEDRWSILECAEHVAAVEGGMLRLIGKGVPLDAAVPHDPSREENIRKNAANRSRPLAAPELAHPRGRFVALSDAVEQFTKRREESTRYVESCSDDLRRLAVLHPVFGEITCHECLWLLIGHPARHAEQIREIRALARVEQRP